ncbi:uncharacterized protein LOC134778734 [Penaeus indicus]|uniref:uncharacterized protein LOC134778734 n=1 Tax=Penaeus indicus TaxID=29960 RepID=UPI00300DABFA
MSASPSAASGTAQSHVFTTKDYCLFRLFKMINTVASQALLFVLNWCTKGKKNEVMTYWDFFTVVEGFSWTKLKNEFRFDTTMKQALQTKPPKEFDVSLLSACIRFACRTRTDAQDLLSHVKSVKDFRNNIIHEGLDDSSSFRPKTDDLEQFLTELVNTAETIFSIPSDEVSTYVKTMKDNINQICSEHFSQADMSEYRNEYLQEKLKSVGIANLKNFYKQLQYITPLHYLNENIPLLVSMIYIQLEIVDAGKGSKGQQVIYTDLFQHMISSPSGHPSNKAKVILVEGPSGVGKTTLTRLLINGWSEGDSSIEGLEDFDFLLFVECRVPHIEKFSELLVSLMPDMAMVCEGDEILKNLLRKKVLVIVDGLDEMNPSSKKLFQEILYNTRTSNMVVLATTRAEALKTYYKIVPEGICTTHIKIIGIPEDKREAFAIKYHEEMKKTKDYGCDTKGLVQYVRRMGINLTEYWRIPLHLGKLVMLWVLWPDVLNAVTTVTELFMETEVLIDEELTDRLIKNNKCNDQLPEDIAEKINNQFRPELYRLALYGQREEGLILSDKSEKTLKKVCEDMRLSWAEVIGAFFVQRSMWTKTGTVTKYSYSHRGTQDFYSALYILNELKEPKNEACSGQRIRCILKDVYRSDPENFTLKKFQEVLVHLISLLYTEGEISNQETSEEIVQLLEESGVNDKQAWLDILSNVKASDTITSLVSKYVPDVMNLKSQITISDAQVFVYSKLITRASPLRVTVSLAKNPSSVPNLQDLLQAMLPLKCEMEVYFHNDFLHPTTANCTTDLPLLKLFEEGSITKYMGSARKEILTGLPHNVEMLYMSVADQSQLEDLMTTVMRLKRLEWLCIHAAAELDLGSQPALFTMNHILFEARGDSSVKLTIRKPTSGPISEAHMKDVMNVLGDRKAVLVDLHLREDWSLVADKKIISVTTSTRSSFDVSNLNEVLTLLSTRGNPDKRLRLYFKYESPQHESTDSSDEATRGSSSSHGMVAGGTPQSATALQELISSLSMKVSSLYIHVMPEVDPSTLQPFTRSIASSLVLSSLQDMTVSWAVQVMEALNLNSRCRYLFLPQVNLSEAGYVELLRSIRVKWHIVAPVCWPRRIRSANLRNITLERLKCDLILLSHEEMLEAIQKMSW